MFISFRFFDKKEWSIYATIQTIIILILFYPFFNYTLEILTLASIISMIDGDLFAKIIFIFFLCILTFWRERENNKFWINSLIVCIVTLIMDKIPINNKIYKFIEKSNIIKAFLFIGIFIWMFYFSYKLISILFI